MIPLLISKDGEDGLEFDELKEKHGPFAYSFKMDLLELDPGEQLNLGGHIYKRVDDPPTKKTKKKFIDDPGRTASGVKIRHTERGQQYINPGELLTSENVRKKIRQVGEWFDEMQKQKRQ